MTISEPDDGFTQRLALLEQFPERVSAAMSDGRLIGYRESSSSKRVFLGNAIPVVLLHGIGSGSASWVRQLEALGQQRRVLAWDAPGYGQSSNVVDAEPVAPAYAQALSSLLDNQNIERCVVVGHSLGAIMGAAFAAKHPDRVAGLFLLSPAAGYGSASEAVRESKREARLTMIRTLGPLGMAAARSANMLSENADSGARAWVQRSMSMVHVRGYTQATYLLANADLLRDVTAYGGRIGVVAGADDTITPPSGCAVVARAAGVALQVVPATGHAGYVEAPDVFSALIRDFCEVCEHANQSRTT